MVMIAIILTIFRGLPFHHDEATAAAREPPAPRSYWMLVESY